MLDNNNRCLKKKSSFTSPETKSRSIQLRKELRVFGVAAGRSW